MNETTQRNKTAEMDTSAKYIECLCRTCLNEVQQSSDFNSTNQQQQWLSIFEQISECGGLLITELISKTVPQIEMQLSDERPSKICCKCLQQLLSAYRFQQMCIQSEEQIRAVIASKSQTDLRINNADSYSLNSSLTSGTLQNLQIAPPEPLLEATTAAAIKPEPADQDPPGVFSAFIKNEPIEDDEADMEYSDGDTVHSTISVKNEVLSVEAEEQQINGNSSQHKCHRCNKVFQALGNLNKHLKRHKTNDSSNRPFSCTECGKSYKEKWVLTKHLQTHGEEKPYECPYCPLSFHTNTNISRHISTHEGVKREDCDICGKSIRASDIKKHRLIHSNEKPYKCDFCEMRFIDKKSVRRHMRKHTGERPFKCKYCEGAYTSHGLMLSHLRTHLGKNIYRCEFCPLAFRYAVELRLHLPTHKNEDPETRQRNMQALKEEEEKLQLKSFKNKTPQRGRPKKQDYMEIKTTN